MTAQERFDQLQESRPHLRLFALVDGLVHQQLHDGPLERDTGCAALFDGTGDAALAWAGPWLVDGEHQPELIDKLQTDELVAPHVSWLLAEQSFDGLVQLLQLKLDARLPDGGTALLRFWDPRVLRNLAQALTPAQREDFFGYVLEWHFYCDGHHSHIGRANA